MTSLCASRNVHERHEVIDALRGFALAGVFLANLAVLSLYRMLPADTRAGLPTAWFDTPASQLINVLVDGKFITIFTLLFGLGFAVQLERAEARGTAGLARYVRRLLVLLVIGAVHAHFVWWGDILLTYAIAGLLLVPARRWSNRALIGGGLAAIFVLPPLLSSWIDPLLPPAPDDAALFASGVQAFSSGDVARVVAANAQLSIHTRIDNWTLLCLVAGRFLLGYWAGRRGLLQQPERHRALIGRIFAASVGLGVVLTLMYRVDSMRDGLTMLGDATGTELAHPVHLGTGLSLGIAFATGFVLLYLQPRARAVLRVLAPAGRMALTLYLAQSLIGIALFYGIGAGIGPYHGVAPWLVAWAGAFALQVALSHVWLAHFRYGPMEWLWRWMTAGVRPQLRRPAIA